MRAAGWLSPLRHTVTSFRPITHSRLWVAVYAIRLAAATDQVNVRDSPLAAVRAGLVGVSRIPSVCSGGAHDDHSDFLVHSVDGDEGLDVTRLTSQE
jgi:hypothetical protein